jgi:Tfp pilus assembly protein PilF
MGDAPVAAWREPLTIDTYLPEAPDPFPAFLHARVYQGSSGRVFPLPFIGRISRIARPVEWDAVHLENEFLRVLVLPGLGGRVHIAYDRVANADLFYRNNVIKPALVGLTGPWIAGGIEFNWPQHHRPTTFLPVEARIEHGSDGSVTVWCSDHEPFAGMKGMHGIRLRPGCSRLEVVGRLHNRGELREPFLWWANAAVSAGPGTQSFFPGDVRYMADHARRAVTAFPVADRPYYGIDYPARVVSGESTSDRLDWYRSIPVPTSFMVPHSDEEFFGGYDHDTATGFVHWAPREVSPGKKQWTWGASPFGEGWERNLTDADGPYLELMAGIYTDNQPDFAWLAPGETKTFEQCWYPIAGLGPATHATRELAAALRLEGDGDRAGVGGSLTLVASEPLDVEVRVTSAGGDVVERVALRVGVPRSLRIEDGRDVRFEVVDGAHRLLAGSLRQESLGRAEPRAAVAPPSPAAVATTEQLFLIGSHLAQYRHATRHPEPYWREALRRDPDDVRSAVALAESAYRRAEWDAAIELLRRAVARQTAWAPTPRDGEALYLLGLALRRTGDERGAREALARASWDAAWYAPASLALARSLAADDPRRATALLREVTRRHPDLSAGVVLLAELERAEGCGEHADVLLDDLRHRDPLDVASRLVSGEAVEADASAILDAALDLAAARLDAPAQRILDLALDASTTTPAGQVQVAPLVHYHRAALRDRRGDVAGAAGSRRAARDADARGSAASRLEDVAALRSALDRDPGDGRAARLLGDWMYARDRPHDAIALWRRAAENGDRDDAAIAHRNLGIASYNVERDGAAARRHYRSARGLLPDDPQLLAETDQLRERLGDSTGERLAALLAERELVHRRDDLVLVVAELLIATGRFAEARDVLANRAFQPWEGGEGRILRAWDAAALGIARASLAAGEPAVAATVVRAALDPPRSLGEARHPLASVAELYLVLGDALRGDDDRAAVEAWRVAARASGDFTRMVPQRFGVQTAWSIAALRRLGELDAADRMRADLDSWLAEHASTPARIDFFATSLPTMQLFVDDPQRDRDAEVAALRAALARDS